VILIELQVLGFKAKEKQRIEDVVVVFMAIAWVSMLTTVMGIIPTMLLIPCLPFLLPIVAVTLIIIPYC